MYENKNKNQTTVFDVAFDVGFKNCWFVCCHWQMIIFPLDSTIMDSSTIFVLGPHYSRFKSLWKFKICICGQNLVFLFSFHPKHILHALQITSNLHSSRLDLHFFSIHTDNSTKNKHVCTANFAVWNFLHIIGVLSFLVVICLHRWIQTNALEVKSITFLY